LYPDRADGFCLWQRYLAPRHQQIIQYQNELL